MEEGHNGDLSVLVEFMAVQSGMPEAVLASHVPDSHGDCVGCGGQRGVEWPCVHHKCAVAARELRASWGAGPARLVELIKPPADGHPLGGTCRPVHLRRA
ncbi:hypothetical protein [Pseudonocardia spinosispora]|uniref:hypothetical protein n=1 Tax=Pseudonocardia spinosispora TaxID=103441 RepID=UPI00048B3F71|nr:hypothetical protein [Pseudonocardia spinosispora]